MSASDAWDDAQRIKELLEQNALKQESIVQLRVPLSSFMTAMNNLSRVILYKRIEERLTISG